jgi:hypothetical protein
MSDEREDAVAQEAQHEPQEAAELEDLNVSEAESGSVVGGGSPLPRQGGGGPHGFN